MYGKLSVQSAWKSELYCKAEKMTGEFSEICTEDLKQLDVFAMNVNSDNKKAGCSSQANDYSKAQIHLRLKWISAKTTELCTDLDGKQCLELYLIKQK